MPAEVVPAELVAGLPGPLISSAHKSLIDKFICKSQNAQASYKKRSTRLLSPLKRKDSLRKSRDFGYVNSDEIRQKFEELAVKTKALL